MEDMFETIKFDYEVVKEELLSIVNQNLLAFEKYDFSNSISVHVRLGDFANFNQSDFTQGTTNMRMPIDWYVKIINQLRGERNNNVYVFSDGQDKELSPLISMPNVHRVQFGSAIAD